MPNIICLLQGSYILFTTLSIIFYKKFQSPIRKIMHLIMNRIFQKVIKLGTDCMTNDFLGGKNDLLGGNKALPLHESSNPMDHLGV